MRPPRPQVVIGGEDQEEDMLLRNTDPFRDFDRLTQQLLGTTNRPVVMPLDAWREGDRFIIEFDLPGVTPETIDLDVERNVLTVSAERVARNGDREMLASERPRGRFSRQLVLGDNLDLDKIEAGYDGGVLRLTVPVAEKAKPRKIQVSGAESGRTAIEA
jgi:HSP20 family protein